jgi:hypothetical protein
MRPESKGNTIADVCIFLVLVSALFMSIFYGIFLVCVQP